MFYLKLDDDNYIVCKAAGEIPLGELYIEITMSEFVKSSEYKKFNSDTREFSEGIKVGLEELSDKQKIQQLEETIGILAEKVAKQGLEM